MKKQLLEAIGWFLLYFKWVGFSTAFFILGIAVGMCMVLVGLETFLAELPGWMLLALSLFFTCGFFSLFKFGLWLRQESKGIIKG